MRATDRRAGIPGDKDPNSPMLPIIEHADIRRLLMEQKVAVEGSIALLTYCSQLVDQQLISDDPQASQRLTLLLELLTPYRQVLALGIHPRGQQARHPDSGRLWLYPGVPGGAAVSRQPLKSDSRG